ncbi:MAG: STAS domain-containing protein [Lachnospiraceae bacterium]|nr:STAS domain-containing protein [Lachnospiraceae bacterium]
MFDLVKKTEGKNMEIKLSGRLDANSYQQLETVIRTEIDGIESLVFDCEALEYISSAGLRVFLSAQKLMSKQGTMVVKKVCKEVYEIFEVTGFADVLTIE